MNHAIKPLANKLKTARETKGLSQRALSEHTGIPQAQISKIERGLVDAKISSLLTMARALDLELMLVSRKLVPAIEVMDRDQGGAPSAPRPAYSLEDEGYDG